MADELTVVESLKLENLEIVIQAGLKSFLDVGRALLEIRDQRLYRKEHDTFEAYCEMRWDMTRSQADRLASAAETVDCCLTPIGVKPSNESQVRPLTKLPLEDRASAWNEAVAVSDGKPTAAVVEQVVASRVSEANGHHKGENIKPKELSKGEVESKEIRDVFKDRLGKVTDGAVYTIESLTLAIGSRDTRQAEAREFIRQCEVSPAVKVLRTYGRKNLVQYTFVATKCVTAHARIRQLADQIANDSSVNGRAHAAAEQILSLLGG